MIVSGNRTKKFLLKNRYIVSILILCFVLSLGYSFYYKIDPKVDARAYDNIAQNIVAGNGYREGLDTPLIRDNAIIRVGPIYEYFLAGLYKIFGHHYEAVWIAQALLRVLSTLLLYAVVLLIFKDSESREKIALWAAAAFAFYPDLIEISAMLMTETLYIFFVCLFLYTFFKYVDVPDKKWLLILGLVSGLAVLARPPMLFVLPVVAFYFIKNKKWKEIIIYVTILCAVFAPWTIRNYRIYGTVMPFGIAGSVNFWIGNHIGANGEQETSEEINVFIRDHSITEIDSHSMLQFKDYVFNHTQDFIELSLERANKYFSTLRPMGFWFYSSGWRQAIFVLCSAAFSFVILTLSLSGAVLAIKFRKKPLYYLLAFTVLTPLILFITVVETRYRFQIYPFLAIFAAYFIQLFGQDKKLWFRTLFVASVVILLNGLLDGLINLDHFKDKVISRF